MLPEDIDKLFRDRLEGHAPPPPAHLWAQLAEELQPRKKRPVSWMWAAAAAVALLLVSGALWLQLASLFGTGSDLLATRARPVRPGSEVKPRLAQPEKKRLTTVKSEATPAPALASTPSKAAPAKAPAVALHQPKGPRPKGRFLATTPTGRTTRAARASEVPKPAPAPATLAATTPNPQPEQPSAVTGAGATLQSPATTALAVTPPALIGPIEVEVHRSRKTVAGAIVSTTGNSRRSLGGVLLRQARNVVRGDRVSLAETGLPETVTVQARVAGRTLTKVIQL